MSQAKEATSGVVPPAARQVGKSGISPEHSLLAVGLAAITTWALLMLTSANPYYSFAEDGVVALERAYFPLFAGLVAGYVAISLAGTRSKDLLERTVFPGICSALLVVGTAGSVLLNANLISMALLCFASGVLCAVVNMALALRFFHLHSRDGLLLSALAFGLTAVLLVAFSWISQPLCFFLVVALGPLSGACMLLFDKKNDVTVVHDARWQEVETGHRLAIGFAVLVAIWGGTAELARSLYVHGSLPSITNTTFSHAQSFAMLVIVVIVLVSLVGILFLPKSFDLSLPYRIILLVTLLAVTLLPFSVDADKVIVPYAISCSAMLLFSMMTWMLSLAVARTQDDCPVVIIAHIRAAWSLGTMAGFAVSLAIYPQFADHPDVIILIQSVLCPIVIFSYLTAFPEQNAKALSQLYPNPRRERFRSKCARVGERFGLSERETEVMMHFAMGQGADQIAEELFISYNTVTTHRKHIYQKLDVHSQRELIELLDKEPSVT